MSEWEDLRRQLLQQSLRLLQIERVEALSEPAVDRSEQFAGLLRLARRTPEACGGSWRRGVPRTLLAADGQR